MDELLENSHLSNGTAVCFFAIGTLLALSLPIVLKFGKSTEETKSAKSTA